MIEKALGGKNILAGLVTRVPSRMNQFSHNTVGTQAAGIQTQIRGTVPIVEVIGDLDLGDVRAFDDALQRASRSSSLDVIVSLAKTGYFNSGAVRAILRLANHLAEENRHLLLVAPRGRTPRRVLDIVYMTSDLLPFESVEEALAAIEPTA